MAAHRNNTPSGVTATSLPTPHPRLVELIERRALRKKVERAVSVLIAVLDEIDADADAEPDLGAPEQTERFDWTYGPQLVAGRDQRRWAAGTRDDRETVDEDGGDILDGGDDDRVDGEPSLGALENIDQTRWAESGRRDLEWDPAEHGIADQDGLAEQWSARVAGLGEGVHVE